MALWNHEYVKGKVYKERIFEHKRQVQIAFHRGGRPCPWYDDFDGTVHLPTPRKRKKQTQHRASSSVEGGVVAVAAAEQRRVFVDYNESSDEDFYEEGGYRIGYKEGKEWMGQTFSTTVAPSTT